MLKLKNQTERQEQKQIQWYLKCDRQKEQEIEYRYATGHLVHSTAVLEIITAQDQEQPTEPDRVQEATGETCLDNLPMEGCRAESERIRCNRVALISN